MRTHMICKAIAQMLVVAILVAAVALWGMCSCEGEYLDDMTQTPTETGSYEPHTGAEVVTGASTADGQPDGEMGAPHWDEPVNEDYTVQMFGRDARGVYGLDSEARVQYDEHDELGTVSCTSFDPQCNNWVTYKSSEA